MLKLIQNDMFNIVKRIKSIDKNYAVFYNMKKKIYQLYYAQGFKFVFELSLGKELNYLSYKKVLQTRYKDISLVVKNIEKDNLKIQQDAQKDKIEECIFKCRTLLKRSVI